MIFQHLPYDRSQLDAEQHKLIELLEEYLTPPSKSLWQKLLSYFYKSKSGVNGVYVHGKVGRGKSMICKAYFKEAKVAKEEKLYMHYHEFLSMIHKTMHQMHGKKTKMRDAVAMLASTMKYRLICIDEFDVKDITDAMILYRLFGRLIAQGTFIVMTSNAAPQDLYEGGLQRERFLPFIALLKKTFNLFQLDSEFDYRVGKLVAQEQRILWGADSATKLDELINKVVPLKLLAPKTITIFGRQLELKHTGHGVLISSFDELCTQDLSYNDYLEICSNFDVVIIKNVPQLDDERVNETIRFIHLIDAIYMHKKLLLLNSDLDGVENLYQGTLRAKEIKRARSRLIEMNSEEYAQ